MSLTVIANRSNKTVYRDGDKTIKIFEKGSSAAAILNEARNQAIVYEHGMNTPRILSFREQDGHLVTESQFIQGESLAVLYEKNESKRGEYLQLFVDLQVQLHSKSSTFLSRLRDKLDRQISQSSLSATTRFFLHTRLKALDASHCICHGDFNLSNIVLTEDGTAYILDWSRATQGNPLADAAMTCILFSLDGRADLAREYTELYCESSGHSKQEVLEWVPIVAASHSVEVDEQSRELLLGWVEKFDLID